jgi:hypothetical protein
MPMITLFAAAFSLPLLADFAISILLSPSLIRLPLLLSFATPDIAAFHAIFDADADSHY